MKQVLKIEQLIERNKCSMNEGMNEGEKIKYNINNIINLSQLESPYIKEITGGLDLSVIGQQEAKQEVAKAISNALTRIGDKKGPLATLFFHGPTGVGKTEIVRALSKILFGVENGYIKIDCAEFAEGHSKSRLFGAPPSYIGYNDPAIFDSDTFYQAYDIAKKSSKLNPILKKFGGFNIILFDEVEKAHKSVIQSLLGVLDEGVINLANPKKAPINFGNSLIIFTSNIGEQDIVEKSKNEVHMGFMKNQKEKQGEEIDRKKVIKRALNLKFSPEFQNRITSFIEFKKLNNDEIRQIIDLNIFKYEEKINGYFINYPNISIDLSEEIYDYIITHGYDKDKGARNLVRVYDNLIESKLNILFSLDNFKSFEHKNGILSLNLFVENDDIMLSLDYIPLVSNGVEENNFDEIFRNNFLINKKTLVYKLDSIKEEGGFLDFSSLNNLFDEEINLEQFILFNKGKVFYFLNKNILEEVNKINNFCDTFSGVNLNSDNLQKLGIKSRMIEKIIQNIIKNNNLEQNLDSFNHILSSLYDIFYPIAFKKEVDIQKLIQDFIPIVLKILKK